MIFEPISSQGGDEALGANKYNGEPTTTLDRMLGNINVEDKKSKIFSVPLCFCPLGQERWLMTF